MTKKGQATHLFICLSSGQIQKLNGQLVITLKRWKKKMRVQVGSKTPVMS